MTEGTNDRELESDYDNVVEIEDIGEFMLFGLIYLGGRSDFVGRDAVLGEVDNVVGGSVEEPLIVNVFFMVILGCDKGKELEALRLLPRAIGWMERGMLRQCGGAASRQFCTKDIPVACTMAYQER